MDDKFPDMGNLRLAALVTQFGAFAAILSVNVVIFVAIASPYGWPARDQCYNL
jgi:hypothetical protein